MSTGTIPQTDKKEGFSLRQLIPNDVGQLPVVAALIVISVYFQLDSKGLFLTPRNLNNLVLQFVTIAIIGLGATLVLLIGEIDLSLSAVSAFCGAVTVTTSVNDHFPAWEAIIAGLLVGAVVGFINGSLVAFLRVPSFIVTLAALIGYTGFLLHILLPVTDIHLFDPFISGLTSNYLPNSLGFGLPIVGVGIYAVFLVYGQIARRNRGLSTMPTWQLGLQIGLIVALTAGVLYVFDNYLGVPYVAVILIGLTALMWIITRFTTFGRHVYAVGGNAEAARRVGINVTAVRIAIFTLASTLAAVAGILEASRTASAFAQVDSTLLLNAIAAAVIGGVSLFGGRGSVWGVLLGALVIEGLLNGLVLQGRNADVQEMVEAVVLILAVIVDAVLRRRPGS